MFFMLRETSTLHLPLKSTFRKRQTFKLQHLFMTLFIFYLKPMHLSIEKRLLIRRIL